MSLSPFDHPILSAWLNAGDVPELFSFEAEISSWLEFEVELARAQSECGLFDFAHVETIAVAADKFSPDIDELRHSTRNDGLPIPGFVAQFRAATGGEAAKYIHFGATSQDVIDTGLMLRLKRAQALMDENLDTLIEALEFLIRREGDSKIMGVTRMQNALQIKAGQRMENWHQPLVRCRHRLNKLGEKTFCLQLGGAVGDNQALGDKAEAVTEKLADFLQLAAPERSWQTTRDALCSYASALSIVTGTLGKMGADIGLMAQNDVNAITLSGGGGSSAMAHKKNPVLAESLVTLARFNAVQLSAMHLALVHEMERSGSAWALEWLVLPQMVAATAAAIGNAGKLISMVEKIG